MNRHGKNAPLTVGQRLAETTLLGIDTNSIEQVHVSGRGVYVFRGEKDQSNLTEKHISPLVMNKLPHLPYHRVKKEDVLLQDPAISRLATDCKFYRHSQSAINCLKLPRNSTRITNPENYWLVFIL